MDEQDIANDTNSKVFNRSAVTLAYIIDTAQFEADYGFPFPSIDGVSNAGTITLFLEFTCLSEVEFVDADIGSSLDSGDIIVGYSHDGYYSDRYDSGLWRHRLNRDECVPHVGVKTYFMSGEVSRPEPPQRGIVRDYSGDWRVSDKREVVFIYSALLHAVKIYHRPINIDIGFFI